MGAEGHGWRPLGAVLVQAGLLSEDDLAETLAEQQRSGELLGTILVARGHVSAAAVANALAEQYGGFLKSEHGFGTGLRESLDESSTDTDSPRAPPVSRPEPTTSPTETTPVPTIDPPTSGSAPSEAPPSEQRKVESAHTLFVPTHNGYLLLNREGPAPPLGEHLELAEVPDRKLIVVKISSSPLPTDPRRCAYLQEL